MNQEKIWIFFQKEGNEVFLNSISRLNYLFKQAQKKKLDTEPTVLNIGVGNGWIEKRCMEQGWNTYSLDPSQEAINSMKTIGLKGKVGYIEKNPYADDFFDIIFCSEVIEHLSEEQINLGLLEIVRVLKKGGVLIGSVPYKENLLDNQVVCPKCGEIFHKWGHQQSFDVKSLIEIFPQTLTVQEIRIVCFVSWESLNWKGMLNSSIKKGLSMVGIHGSGENILFILKKES